MDTIAEYILTDDSTTIRCIEHRFVYQLITSDKVYTLTASQRYLLLRYVWRKLGYFMQLTYFYPRPDEILQEKRIFKFQPVPKHFNSYQKTWRDWQKVYAELNEYAEKQTILGQYQLTDSRSNKVFSMVGFTNIAVTGRLFPLSFKAVEIREGNYRICKR